MCGVRSRRTGNNDKCRHKAEGNDRQPLSWAGLPSPAAGYGSQPFAVHGAPSFTATCSAAAKRRRALDAKKLLLARLCHRSGEMKLVQPIKKNGPKSGSLYRKIALSHATAPPPITSQRQRGRQAKNGKASCQASATY